MNKILSVFTILPLAFISGCNTFKNYYHESKAPYSMNNILLSGEIKENDKSNAMLNRYKELYFIAYERALVNEGFKIEENMIKNDATNDSYDNKVNQRLFLTGTQYAQLLCTQYLQRLDGSKANRAYASQQTDIFGGAMSAVMGLVGIPSKTLGGTSLAFSSMNSSMKAYENSFMLSPEIEQVEKLVREKMNGTKNQYIVSKDGRKEFKGLDSFYDAISALEEYTYHCSQTGIKALVKNAMEDKISSTTIEAQKTGTEKNLEAQLRAETDRYLSLLQAYQAAMKEVQDAKEELEKLKGDENKNSAKERVNTANSNLNTAKTVLENFKLTTPQFKR